MKRDINFIRGFKVTTAMVLGVLLSMTGFASAAENPAWDKTFPLSDKVIHEKVSYPNRYGITVSADMYLLKDIDKSKKYAALVVGTPYGGVKEQGGRHLCADNGGEGICRHRF